MEKSVRALFRVKGLKNSHFFAIIKKEIEIDKSGFAEDIYGKEQT